MDADLMNMSVDEFVEFLKRRKAEALQKAGDAANKPQCVPTGISPLLREEEKRPIQRKREPTTSFSNFKACQLYRRTGGGGFHFRREPQDLRKTIIGTRMKAMGPRTDLRLKLRANTLAAFRSQLKHQDAQMRKAARKGSIDLNAKCQKILERLLGNSSALVREPAYRQFLMPQNTEISPEQFNSFIEANQAYLRSKQNPLLPSVLRSADYSMISKIPVRGANPMSFVPAQPSLADLDAISARYRAKMQSADGNMTRVFPFSEDNQNFVTASEQSGGVRVVDGTVVRVIRPRESRDQDICNHELKSPMDLL